tara:strand:+ start:13526 stop:14128 length:603 start_codon:yes stop_codon:yes gene_type:complete
MEILLALSCCVRAFTACQIADGFFEGNINKARRLIVILVSQRLLVKNRLPIRQLPALERPLAKWRAGEDAPEFEAIVVKIRNRWQAAPTKVTPIYLAGPSAKRVLGYRATGTLKRHLQASHDLGLASVYLAVRRDRPQLAKFWYGEDIAPKLLGSVPDAIYINGDGKSSLAFEFCGLYSAKRLRTFHRHCAQRRLGYELW